MKQLLCALLFTFPFFAISQGIQFIKGINWQQIKSKASTENKMIFVDCYATWCGPCKEMDKNVFTDALVGDEMQRDFICIRLQMDSSAIDNNLIKMQYSLAKLFESEYKITSLPTFLFFSSSGDLLHKGVGYINIKGFMALLSDVRNPNKQYYSLINKWHKGEIAVTALPELAKISRNEYNNRALANQIARDYMLRYLDLLDDKDFWSKENLSFLGQYASVITSSDKAFRSIYFAPEKVDSISGKINFAKGVIKIALAEEFIVPWIKYAESQNGVPDWEKFQRIISRKFNKGIAYQVVLDARVDWYRKNSEMSKYTTYLVKQLKEYGVDSTNDALLNHVAWQVFKYSRNKKTVHEALYWSELSLKKTNNQYDSSQYIDTKACLLYKLGRTREAIELEESNLSQFFNYAAYIQPRLDKMRKGGDISMLD